MRRTLSLLTILLTLACSTTTRQPDNTTTVAKQPLFGPHGFDLTGMDPAVKACDDFYRVGGQNDFKNSKMIIASVGTGQLGLPDRDYYLRDDERFKNIRSQYVDHMARMLSLTGEDASQARSDADRILQLETRLAQAQMPREEMRNPENRYHMMPVAQLASTAPIVDWNAYLAALGINQPSINVTEPAYIQTMNRLLSDVPL